MASAVQWGDALEVLWVSAASGIGVTVLFALAILGGTRAVELRRDGRTGAAGAYAAVMAAAGTGVAVAVVFGIVVMTQKA